VQPKPALGDGSIKSRSIFGNAGALSEERGIDTLDVNASVLGSLRRIGDLDQLARAGVGIGELALSGEFHWLYRRR
jgi:hypothetical protein